MRSIIETGSKLNFKFRQIDKEIHADFIKKMHDYCGPEHNLLFANILFLFSKKTLVDYLLSFLEEDIKQQWEKEKQTTASTLELHTNPAYTSYIGLLWPEPTTELASNHSHNLLSRVLLQMEQRHGLNIKYAKTAPVPTLIGFVSPDDVRRLVQQKQLWNDDPRLGGLFYHGKMTHRVQCYMLMKAVELGILDLGDMSIPALFNLLLTRQYDADGNKRTLPWNALVDGVIAEKNIGYEDSDHLAKLTELFPTTISGVSHRASYIYASDPAYFHAYLMSVSRRNTPYLSECLTQTFCKSAQDILELEREVGLKSAETNYMIHRDMKAPYVPLPKAEQTIAGTMHRQALSFNVFNSHPVSTDKIMESQQRAAKSKRIDKRRSFASMKEGFVQYRVFKRPPPTEVPEAAAHARGKRNKVV